MFCRTFEDNSSATGYICLMGAAMVQNVVVVCDLEQLNKFKNQGVKFQKTRDRTCQAVALIDMVTHKTTMD